MYMPYISFVMTCVRAFRDFYQLACAKNKPASGFVIL